MNRYDHALRYEIFQKGEYLLAKNALIEAEVIFDIGSHLGFFAEWCREIGSQAEIFCFEPMEGIQQEAKKRLNRDDKVSFFSFGIGQRDEEIDFFVHPEKTMQSGKYESFLNPRGKKRKVQMQPLAPFLEHLEVGVNIAVKMDIEGMEYEVLESLGEDIWEKISTLVLEVHFLHPEDEEKWGKLRNFLQEKFGNLEEKKSVYDPRISLIFCHR